MAINENRAEISHVELTLYLRFFCKCIGDVHYKFSLCLTAS